MPKAKHLCAVKFCRNPRHQRRTVCAKHAMQQWRRDNPVTNILNTIRSRAKRENIPFSLTLIEFKAFCHTNGYQPGKDHIDREEATEGYHLWNLCVLSSTENIAKGNRERHSERYQAYLASRKGVASSPVEIDCPY